MIQFLHRKLLQITTHYRLFEMPCFSQFYGGSCSFLLITLSFLTCGNSLNAQSKFVLTHNDSLALENVIVEKYYCADSSDYSDTAGGILLNGSITYRIYIDMKPGYALQMVYGDKKHALYIKTSTTFFNNNYCLAITGYNVNPKEINNNTVALDSWITMGAATKLHSGILRSEDTDGSILKRDGLTKTDGLTSGTFPTFKAFNLDLDFFKDRKEAACFSVHDGGWAALGAGGVKGPNAENRVLIAQLTTNGSLSFRLNVQIGTPARGWVKFVAGNPNDSELQFKGLSYE
jgi:hypothetical protein